MDELQQQVMQLVLAAMQGDQQANQQIQQIMQAAQQGDQQAAQVAQMIQAVVQQSQQAQSAKFGAKLNYVKYLRGQCPNGYEMQYFKKGGAICKKCVRKVNKGDSGWISDLKNKTRAVTAKARKVYNDSKEFGKDVARKYTPLFIKDFGYNSLYDDPKGVNEHYQIVLKQRKEAEKKTK